MAKTNGSLIETYRPEIREALTTASLPLEELMRRVAADVRAKTVEELCEEHAEQIAAKNEQIEKLEAATAELGDRCKSLDAEVKRLRKTVSQVYALAGSED